MDVLLLLIRRENDRKFIAVIAVCDFPSPNRTLAMAHSRHVDLRCWMTVVMRSKLRVARPIRTGIWQRNRLRGLRSISASVGEWLSRRFCLSAGKARARRTRRSFIGSCDGAFFQCEPATRAGYLGLPRVQSLFQGTLLQLVQLNGLCVGPYTSNSFRET